MEHLINLFFRSIFVDNMIFAFFLGMCSFLAVSKNVKTSLGLGLAVTFVLCVTVPTNYLLQTKVLGPDCLVEGVDLSYLAFILFIAVIAGIVQLVEMVVERFSPSLYAALGIFLPLITTNCCILGVAILVANGTEKLPMGAEHGMLTGTLFAFATALGFGLALILFAGIREQLAMNKVPEAMKGTPIALLTAGLLAMAFMGFSGVV